MRVGAALLLFSGWPTSSHSEPTAELAPVTVSAERIDRPLGASASSILVLDREELDATSAQRLDDALRRVPGFTLFRRQPSIVANPTTQGASLRGLGGTGASRALVLVDGVPLYDPFGGWVYWGRLPLELVERVEVVRGGGSSLWGSGALSGVINIVTRAPEPRQVLLRAEAGNRDTRRATVVAENAWDTVAGQMDATYDLMGGYYLVSGGERVAFDSKADSRDVNFGLRTDWSLSDDVVASVRLRYFDEKRDNGTELTGNKTDLVFAHAGIEGSLGSGDGFSADVFGDLQDYSSTFSAQDRTTGIEAPSLDQFEVPSGSFGVGARWWREKATATSWLAGLDYRLEQGFTHEDYRYIDMKFTRRRKTGGREQFAGAYVQASRHVRRWLEVTAGARVDYWRSDDGERKETDLVTSGEIADVSIGPRDDVFVSPRIGVVSAVNRILTLRAAAYRGFRAPTLNELYRPFRVRNDITEANADLDLERLTGADLGFDTTWGRATFSATGYWNRLDDPIVNVTVGEGPGDVAPCGFVPDGGVCRQRQNLGRTRTIGLEVDSHVDVTEALRLHAGYLFSDAEIRSNGSAGNLQGNDVPQVPRHQVVLGADWRILRRLDVFLDARYVGSQFDDDANSRRLASYFVINSGTSFELDEQWELFLKAENVLGNRYEVAETADGTITYGPAALVHAGVRYRVR